MMSEEQEWRVIGADGRERGPYSASQLRVLARSGGLTPQSWVWTQSLEEWIPAAQVEGLFPTAPQRPVLVTGTVAAGDALPDAAAPDPSPLPSLKGLVWTARGLKLVIWGFVLFWLHEIIFDALPDSFDTGSSQLRAFFKVIGVFGFLMGLSGRLLCLTAPRSGFGRSYLVASLGCAIAGAAFLLLSIPWGVVFVVTLWLTGEILFLVFLTKLAEALKLSTAVSRAKRAIVFAGIAIVMFVSLLILAYGTLKDSPGFRGGQSFLAILIFACVFLYVMWSYISTFCKVVGGLADAIWKEWRQEVFSSFRADSQTMAPSGLRPSPGSRPLLKVSERPVPLLVSATGAAVILTIALVAALPGRPPVSRNDPTTPVPETADPLLEVKADPPAEVTEAISGEDTEVPSEKVRTEALATMAKLEKRCLEPSPDTVMALDLASLQIWFGLVDDFEALRDRLLAWAHSQNDVYALERVAKLASLRELTDPLLQEKTLALAGRAVKLAGDDPGKLAWARLALGMAEFRCGHPQSAEKTLEPVVQDRERPDPRLRSTAAFYRAMALAGLDREAEARDLFQKTEAEIELPPPGHANPRGGDYQETRLILWLAYREAARCLDLPVREKPAP